MNHKSTFNITCHMYMYMYMYMYMSYVLARHMAHAATLVSGVELLGTDSRRRSQGRSTAISHFAYRLRPGVGPHPRPSACPAVWLTPLVMTPWFSRLDFWVARVLN